MSASVDPFVHSPDCEEPDPVNDCKCGANRHCRTCGWGCGQFPCACRPAHIFGNGSPAAVACGEADK